MAFRFRRAAVRGALALFVGSAPAAGLAASAPSAPSSQQGGVGADALRSAVTDEETRRFYEQNGWQAVWTAPARRALQQALSERAAHGLDHVTFLEDSAVSGPESGAQAEAALTKAALRYARALAVGLVDPTTLHQIYTLPRPQTDVSADLAEAMAQGRLAEWLESLPPQDETYAKLSQAYRSAQQKDQSGDAAPRIDPDGLIRVGDSDPRVEAIAQQLTDEGYLSAETKQTVDQDGSSASASQSQSDPSVYTQRLADAVKRLQVDFGIVEDGIVGPNTLEVLNLRPGDRARALAVALERRRWLARNPPATRIDVNIAAARLRYYRDGKVVDQRKVIVGKPGNETPLLMSPIYRLVANPTWTVPKSIENSEMADVSASYLRSRNMVRRDGYIVQQPGPDNALGLVKFDMRNDYAIYLHDTGTPSLFERSQRHLSHGCVRVDDALGFAQMIAQHQGIQSEWQDARAGDDQQFVDLPQPIPVRLLYENAFVNGQGEVAVRTDPYGWNRPVAKALGFDPGSGQRAKAEDVDIGP